MEFKRRKLEVIIDETKHQVAYPNVKQLDEFGKTFNGAEQEKQLSITIDFLDILGLPKEVSYSLEADQLAEIITTISGQKKS